MTVLVLISQISTISKIFLLAKITQYIVHVYIPWQEKMQENSKEVATQESMQERLQGTMQECMQEELIQILVQCT